MEKTLPKRQPNRYARRMLLFCAVGILSFSMMLIGVIGIMTDGFRSDATSSASVINMANVTTAAQVNAHDEFEINSPQGIIRFSELVNNTTNGITFQGRRVFLSQNIQLESPHIPIGTGANPFRGHFDGQGFTVSGIDVSSANTLLGFFGHVAGIATNRSSIRNLTVAGNIAIMGTIGSIAGIAGQANYTDIVNCVNRINITNTSTASVHIMLAGIVASSISTNVINCINHGTLTVNTGTADVGGILAASNNAMVINSINFGSIISPTPLRSLGGVYGAVTTSNIINSVNFGVLPNAVEARVNGIGTTNANMTTTVRNSFSVQVVPDHAVYGRVSNNTVVNSRGGIPLDASGSGDTAGALSDDFLATLNRNANLLRMGQFPGLIGQIFPEIANWTHSTQIINSIATTNVPALHMTAEHVGVELRTEEDIIAFRNAVNGGTSFAGRTVRVMNDITLVENHVPVGTMVNPFRGHFDGQGFTIDGINISSADGHLGFFGRVAGTSETNRVTIKNLTVAGNIVSNHNGVTLLAAGIVARADHADIINCVNRVNITATRTTGHSAIAGIMATSFDGANIISCTNHGTLTVNTAAADVGGIGSWFSYSSIINSVNFGSLITNASTISRSFGGIYAGADFTNIVNSVNFGTLPNLANAYGIGHSAHQTITVRNSFSVQVVSGHAIYGRVSSNTVVDSRGGIPLDASGVGATAGALSDDFLATLNENAALLRTGNFPGMQQAFPEISNWRHTTQTINGTETLNVPSLLILGTRTVTLVIDGVEQAPITVDYDSLLDEPTAPSAPLGHTFTNWRIGAPNGTVATFPMTITENTRLYTHFTRNTTFINASVSSDGGGTISLSGNQSGPAITGNETFTATPNQGHSFVGWTGSATDGLTIEQRENPEITIYFPPTGTVNLVANFEINTFNVEFVVDGVVWGESGVLNPVDWGTVLSDVLVTIPTPPGSMLPQGKNFTHWSDEPNGMTAFDFTNPITSHTRIYAVLDPKQVAVQFLVRGTVVNTQTLTPDDRTVNFPTNITVPNGYTFAGVWVLPNMTTPAPSQIDASYFDDPNGVVLQFHALFTRIQHTVTTVISGETTTITKPWGDSFERPIDDPTPPTGYHFVEWRIGSATGPTATFPIAILENITLHAIFRLNETLTNFHLRVIGNYVLEWEIIPEADEYEILIMVGETLHHYDFTKSNFLNIGNLNFPSARYTIQVRALENGVVIAHSNIVELQIGDNTLPPIVLPPQTPNNLPRLDTPLNFSREGTVFYWSPVEYAIGYQIFINAVHMLTITETFFNLSTLFDDLGYGTFVVNIIAEANMATHWHSHATLGIGYSYTHSPSSPPSQDLMWVWILLIVLGILILLLFFILLARRKKEGNTAQQQE